MTMKKFVIISIALMVVATLFVGAASATMVINEGTTMDKAFLNGGKGEVYGTANNLYVGGAATTLTVYDGGTVRNLTVNSSCSIGELIVKEGATIEKITNNGELYISPESYAILKDMNVEITGNTFYFTKGSEVTYGTVLSYTVTIPTKFEFGSNSAMISPVSVNVAVENQSQWIRMDVASANAFNMTDSSSHKLQYKMYRGDDAEKPEITAGTEHIVYAPKGSLGEHSQNIFFKLQDVAKYAGTYTDKLTFTTTVVESDPLST